MARSADGEENWEEEKHVFIIIFNIMKSFVEETYFLTILNDCNLVKSFWFLISVSPEGKHVAADHMTSPRPPTHHASLTSLNKPNKNTPCQTWTDVF